MATDTGKITTTRVAKQQTGGWDGVGRAEVEGAVIQTLVWSQILSLHLTGNASLLNWTKNCWYSDIAMFHAAVFS